MKILVIDDQMEQLENARKVLAEHEVFTASGWNEGSTAIKSADWDVVLTDLSMPGEADGQPKGSQFVEQQTPYGFALALLALKVGISKVAIVSNGKADANHHSHPIYWASDSLHGEIIPGRLWVFAGYYCPHMDDDSQLKDWTVPIRRLTGVYSEADAPRVIGSAEGL